jgi:hypothetical protein
MSLPFAEFGVVFASGRSSIDRHTEQECPQRAVSNACKVKAVLVGKGREAKLMEKYREAAPPTILPIGSDTLRIVIGRFAIDWLPAGW